MCSSTPRSRPMPRRDARMSRRATIAALLLLGASPAVASAQDTTRKADTAQKLPTATVKEVALNLPETYQIGRAHV